MLANKSGNSCGSGALAAIGAGMKSDRPWGGHPTTGYRSPIVRAAGAHARIDRSGVPANHPPAHGGQKSGQHMSDKVKIRILVIDDDAEFANLLRMQLAAVGYTAEVAEDAVVGGKALIERPPNLILCDINMPHLSGLQLVELMRTDDRSSKIPVIFISGSNDNVTIAKAVALGAADFLAKPISHADLIASVATCLKGGRRPFARDVDFPPVV